MRSPRFVGIAVPLMVALMLVAAGCGKSKSSSGGARAVVPANAGDSLFSESNLKVALNAIAAKLGSAPKVTTFKIEPTSVNVTASSGGQFKVLSSDKSGNVQTASAPAGTIITFPLSKVDPAVPAKIVTALDDKYSKKLDDIDYMVVIADPTTRKPFWDVFVKGGKDGPYQADIDGSNVATAAERAGTVTPPAGTPTIPGGPAPSTAPGPQTLPPDIAKIQRCVTKAGNDPAKAADCVRHARLTIPKPK